MNRSLLVASAAMLCLTVSVIHAQSVTIQYGTVKGSTTVTEKSRHAGGALAGGVLGALIGPSRHRGLRVLAGAGIGAAVEGSATGGTLQQYTVALNNGGTTIINTEQSEIRIQDCVAIEQGEHDNIRRVSSIHCEIKTESPEHHESAATNCQAAKDELSAAQSDDEVTIAGKKVRILCED